MPPSQADIWSTQRFLRFVDSVVGKRKPEILGFINRADTHHAVRESDEAAAALVSAGHPPSQAASVVAYRLPAPSARDWRCLNRSRVARVRQVGMPLAAVLYANVLALTTRMPGNLLSILVGWLATHLVLLGFLGFGVAGLMVAGVIDWPRVTADGASSNRVAPASEIDEAVSASGPRLAPLDEVGGSRFQSQVRHLSPTRMRRRMANTGRRRRARHQS